MIISQHENRLFANAWITTSRSTEYLIENLPKEIWDAPLHGLPGRKVRTIAGHIHNSRCRWIKQLGREAGIAAPALVDMNRVTRKQLLAALRKSSRSMARLFERSAADGGRVPPVTWLNFPRDIAHFLAYFAAHEAHHRGQIILLAHQLGHRLPRNVANGVWQWNTRARESWRKDQ